MAAVVATIEAAAEALEAIVVRRAERQAAEIRPRSRYFKPYKAPLTRLLLEVAGPTVIPVLRVAIPYLQPLHQPEEVVVVKITPTADQVAAAAVAVVLASRLADRAHLCRAAMVQLVTTVREMLIRAVAVVELLLPELPLLEQMRPTAGTASRRQLVDQALREVVAVVVVLMPEVTPEALEQGEVEVAEVLVQLAATQLVAP